MDKHLEKVEELLRLADNALGMFEELVKEGKLPKGPVLDHCKELLKAYKKGKDEF